VSHSKPIRIRVLHRDPVAEAGLSVAFNNRSDFEVHAARDDRAGAVDVVVADYSQGVACAADFTSRGALCGLPKVVVVAGIDREWEIRCALELGVRGYLLIGCSLEELVEGVRAVHRGTRYLSPQVAARLAESISLEALTAREEQVLRLVVEGLCNKAIGRQLGIAVGTVKSHLKSTFDKLNVESRTQAVAVVERRGLLRQSQEQARYEAGSSRARGARPLHPTGVSSSREHAPEFAAPQ
jgi:DNA-binding NarL/FixJ family response regulator